MKDALHPKYRRILSLDGGPFNGVACLVVINRIVQEASTRARIELMPYQVFDLICGTSCGALIAILLGRLRLDCATAYAVYLRLAPALFGISESEFWTTLLQRSKVKTNEFHAALDAELEVLGAGTASFLEEEPTDRQARVFVTTTEDAPHFTNRTHILRSYPSSVENESVPPRGHDWSIREAILAATASKLFVEPLPVGDSGFRFRDAATGGFANPTGLAMEEAKRLWPKEDVGLVVSLGTNLSDLAPKDAPLQWRMKPQEANRFVSGILKDVHAPTPAMRNVARDLVKWLAGVAHEAELVHRRLETDAFLGKLYRLRPVTGLQSTALGDCFSDIEVRDKAEEWLQDPETQGMVATLVKGLVEDVQQLAPPPPPSTTNPGYNPLLDLPRPDNLEDYLRKYRVIFIIDDSSSMKGAYWEETRDALLDIAEHALAYGTNTIDIVFLNNKTAALRIQGSGKIVEIFTTVAPRGRTPTGNALERVLTPHIDHLNRLVGTEGYSKIEPLDIIVLTDGVPSDDPKGVLVKAVNTLKDQGHHPNAVGIQMVQIGNDADAAPALKKLMGQDVGSIVDTVPYNGELLTPSRLERILLGGLHPNMRSILS
ncbi:FabD/lysophospholipase-like protein [Pluteus cervinus]|uniref:FabD/lysophospholipase-like protein n=1 Tax=Pluteus cervinus TaxID=181527 RepID=A0ACD3AWY5_9AGAR|nr:FabD/lysophospholipase-like protein [Pluteus cervinus]